ncbi:hypothetical protein [Enterococcus saccharolyticus]|uniref:ECF transporter S component n=1 Tax=Enterococcus saccharolyticus subsp. saccharolyticus ATCC 43076 TaxID=1139996 RepID=S0JMR6_9ENTE|nr:hypothetical protein [Enterococcus saccharolyticus]EOT29163.1 hypothetical protein OMQ_01115 [Enterococcus saccharolyticus subsp. saccharolyticus ATCC 43076]EOT80962.1 hypothetical protein I572_01494 [Enterococcus saccharolyticus subsp. saccharolyticus ATCC 43076]
MKKEQEPFFSTYEIAYLAMTVAACVVGRTLFQFIPNIQPMTAIFLILTYQLGVTRGLIVNVLALIITNMYMGMGIWTVSQILSFSVVILCMGVLCRWEMFRQHRSLQVAFSVVAGFLYGFVIAGIDVQLYGMPQFWPYYLAGLYFDFLHGVGNGIFYLLLAPVFQKLFAQLKRRLD